MGHDESAPQRAKDPLAVQRGRLGGMTKAANTPDRREATSAARAARWQKYLDAVSDAITDPAERQRSAEILRRADMLRMSMRAASARKKAAEARAAEKRATEELAAIEALSPDSDAA